MENLMRIIKIVYFGYFLLEQKVTEIQDKNRAKRAHQYL
jgi:hypothetical protein